jgi:hypothetical protein
VARAGAVKARTQAGNQLRDLILTAPEQVRRQLAGLPCQRQVDAAARFRPGDLVIPAEGAKTAMASVARRHQQLTAEIARLDAALEELVTHAAPKELLAKQGVATQVAATLLATTGDNPGRVRREASFAALCGDHQHPRSHRPPSRAAVHLRRGDHRRRRRGMAGRVTGAAVLAGATGGGHQSPSAAGPAVRRPGRAVCARPVSP